jgi:hypothetical protein
MVSRASKHSKASKAPSKAASKRAAKYAAAR